FRFFGSPTVEATKVGQELEAREVLGKPQALRKNADLAANSFGIVGAGAIHREVARVGRENRREDADGRRLARSVGTEEAQEASGLQGKRQSSKRRPAFIGLPQVVGHQYRRFGA